MDVVEPILRYLKYAIGKGLLFSNHGHLKVDDYIDVDWASSVDNHRSTSRYFTFRGGNHVTLRSKKQPVVARSSVEAEYRSMAFKVCELLWWRNLLKDLGFKPKMVMKLYCDNMLTIEIVENHVQLD